MKWTIWANNDEDLIRECALKTPVKIGDGLMLVGDEYAVKIVIDEDYINKMIEKKISSVMCIGPTGEVRAIGQLLGEPRGGINVVKDDT